MLLARILYVLGMEGPGSPQPGRYIRHIYNRIILETPLVRGAAVSALARFGAQVVGKKNQKNCFKIGFIFFNLFY